jgi:non-ribosomal peptide synthetase component F
MLAEESTPATKVPRCGCLSASHTNRGRDHVGRRDRMVKRRGYRIELGEIERAM